MEYGKYLISFLFLMLCALLCLSTGRYPLSFMEIPSLLFGGGSEIKRNILFEFRMPRILLALFIGAGLSISGAAFQSLFKNPLSSPDILGVTSGASFGCVLALLLGMNIYFVYLFGLLFGIFALLLSVLVGYTKYRTNTITMILSGVIIAAFFQSLVSLVKYLADPQDVLPTITYWLLGSLEQTLNVQSVSGIVGISLGMLLIFLLRWKINILALDSDEAKTLGVNLNAIRISIVLAVTIIVSCSVSLCGIIGWVGLLIPHIARLLVGSNNASVIPISMFLGAIFLMFIDTLNRSMLENEIPISILTALFGMPFFIFILYRSKGMNL